LLFLNILLEIGDLLVRIDLFCIVFKEDYAALFLCRKMIVVEFKLLVIGSLRHNSEELDVVV
jgi:hypothetical protein